MENIRETLSKDELVSMLNDAKAPDAVVKHVVEKVNEPIVMVIWSLLDDGAVYAGFKPTETKPEGYP